MKQSESARPRARVVAVALGVFLVSAAMAGAAEPGGGPAEGIKVHGHWTMDVRNPDGTLVSHHEVKNALTQGGSALAGLLGRVFTNPKWKIILHGEPPPCNGFPCTISEPGSGGPNENLTVSVPGGVPVPDGTVELNGSVATVGGGDTTITRVESWVKLDAPGLSGNWSFTGRGVSIPVRQGQIIQVKVVFSFS